MGVGFSKMGADFLKMGVSFFENGSWPGHCVVFLGKTLNSHSASLHPGV